MFPEKKIKAMLLIGLTVCMVGHVNAAIVDNPYAPDSTQEAVIRIADELVAQQALGVGGAWPSRGAVSAGRFTGTMAAGLVDAYQMTCNPAYLTAAEAAGDWIMANAAGCSLFYDEVYALMRLSETTCDPGDNIWRTAMEAFYTCAEGQPYDSANGLAGTEWVIDYLEQVQGIPMVVFEVAHYTVGAYYVDSPDKVIWRDALIRLLEDCNAANAEQIWMLGTATWALAQTGDMDETAIYVGSPLSDVADPAETLAELPPLLAAYQVPDSDTYFGSHFLNIYNPVNNSFSGFTETNIYAAMGLAAATQYAGFDYRDAMDRVWVANMQPVDDDGNVDYDAINIPPTEDSQKYFHYAGEYLQYLAATRLPGDTNLNDSVDLNDLIFITNRWLDPLDCDECSRADLNHDHVVNLADVAVLGQGWLASR